jgi:hypothetical protein
LTELEQYKKSNRSKSIAAGDDASTRTRNKEKFCRLARALYAYISNGDNQLSFLEGDVIALMGTKSIISVIPQLFNLQFIKKYQSCENKN